MFRIDDECQRSLPTHGYPGELDLENGAIGFPRFVPIVELLATFPE